MAATIERGFAGIALSLIFALPAVGQTPPAAPPTSPGATSPASAPAAPSTEVEAIRIRIIELEKELSDLRARLRQLDPGAFPPPPPVVAPPPSPGVVVADQALLSLANFIQFSRESYATEFGALPSAAAPSRVDRKIEHWAATMTREWRKPVKWVVRFGKKTQATNETMTYKATILDETTGAPLGDEFDLVFERRETKRYADRLARANPQDHWALSAIFVPRFGINPERMTVGLFDKPPFIGPGVELQYEFNIDTLAPVKPPEPPKVPKPGPSAPDGTAPKTPGS